MRVRETVRRAGSLLRAQSPPFSDLLPLASRDASEAPMKSTSPEQMQGPNPAVGNTTLGVRDSVPRQAAWALRRGSFALGRASAVWLFL